MKINRDNYELYCIDYLDDRLNASERVSFLMFMNENLDIKENLEGMKEISIPQDAILFSDKGSLKKGDILQLPVSRYNFNDFCLTSIEDNLTEIEQKELQQYIHANPGKANDFELFTKSKLIPDHTIIYQHKKNLKRYTFNTLRTPKFLYAAASIAAIFILVFLLIPNSEKKVQPIAIQTIKQPKKQIEISPEKSNSITSDQTSSTVNVSNRNSAAKPKPKVLANESIPISNKDSELVSKTLLIEDKNLDISTTQAISGIEKGSIPTSTDSIPSMEKVANLQQDPYLKVIDKTGLISIAQTSFRKLNELAGNNVKISKKQRKSRKIISIETPLFGFYQSKHE